MPAPERPYAPLTSRYGSVGQNGEWNEAIEAYYWDRLPESFAIAQALGAGFGGAALRWYRMIEGEALTRQASEVREGFSNTLHRARPPGHRSRPRSHRRHPSRL